MAKKKRLSVDSVISFKHQGKTRVVRIKNSKFKPPSSMMYTWLDVKDGSTFDTDGIPKGYKAVSARYLKRGEESMSAKDLIESVAGGTSAREALSEAKDIMGLSKELMKSTASLRASVNQLKRLQQVAESEGDKGLSKAADTAFELASKAIGGLSKAKVSK